MKLLPALAPITRRQALILGLILAAGLSLRSAYLVSAIESQGFVWEDPDGYVRRARLLAQPGAWHWTFKAVTYDINGQRHALPPGYSVFLSVFAIFPGFPLTAQVAQLMLAVISIGLVFALGRCIHSSTVGLIASAGYALSIPNIFNVWSTSQESLYIPLILFGFLILARAVHHDASPLGFAAAGLVFGAAALTRSMPLFFVLPAAGAHVAVARDRRRAAVQGAAFLAGFLLLTAPYSVALSRHFGALTIIDTHGSIHLDSPGGGRAPGILETARALSRTIAAHPAEYFRESLMRTRSLLHVNGGRILQIYVIADDKPAAVLWKCAVHLGTDAVLVFSVVLAAFGAAVCRRPRIAVLFLLWTGLNVAIASLGGFGGARLRTPFEPLLLVLAAAACAGDWRRPHSAALIAAVAISFLTAAAVLPQIPQSLRAWPDYGVKWPSVFDRRTGHFTGAAGINVVADNGVALLTATVADSSAQLHVRVNGVVVRTLQLSGGEESAIRAAWPAGGLAFVELEAARSSAAAIDVRITVPGR